MASSTSVKIIYHQTGATKRTIIIAPGPALLFMLLSHTVEGCSSPLHRIYLKFAAPGILKHTLQRRKWTVRASGAKAIFWSYRNAVTIPMPIGRQKDPNVAVPFSSAARFFIHMAQSAIRLSAAFCNFVCDPRAVASCAITSICIRIPGLSSTSSILPRPPPSYLAGYFSPFSLLFFSSFSFRVHPFPPVSYGFSFISLSLLVAASSLLFAPRAFGHPRTPTNLPVVPIKSAGIVFKLVRAFASYLHVRSSLPRPVSRPFIWSLCRESSLIKRAING